MNIRIILFCSLLFLGCQKETIKEVEVLPKIKLIKRSDEVASTNPSDYHFVTEENAPFSFKEDNKPSGFNTDILVEVFKKLGIEKRHKDISIYSWARSYLMLQKKKNFCLFGTARTKQREKLFKWFGPTMKVPYGLLGKKKDAIRINKIDDLLKYRVWSVKEFAPEQLLVKAGFPLEKLGRVLAPAQLYKMLILDRIELFPTNIPAALYSLKKLGQDTSKFKNYWTLGEKEHWYACHKSTPDSVIEKFQKALDEVRAEGKVKKFISDYL